MQTFDTFRDGAWGNHGDKTNVDVLMWNMGIWRAFKSKPEGSKIHNSSWSDLNNLQMYREVMQAGKKLVGDHGTLKSLSH